MEDNYKPKHRERLNAGQLQILELIYKFRFIDKQVLTDYYRTINKKPDLHRKLEVLLDLGLIGKRYDPDDITAKKTAAYNLLPKGVKKVMEARKPAKRAEMDMNMIYKSKSLSRQYIDHCLDVVMAYNRLIALHKDQIKLFTKLELKSYAHFPGSLLDAYLRLKTKDGDKLYFLNVCSSNERMIDQIKKIKHYVAYAESGEWEITKVDLPVILILCESPALQNKLLKIIPKIVDEAWGTDISFALVDKETFLQQSGAIWQLANGTKEKIALEIGA